MAINIAVFFLGGILGPNLGGRTLSSWLGLYGPELFSGFGAGLLRFVTYQFVHDFYGVMHILGNMLVLWFFGRMVEAEIGARGLVHLYLVGGLTGAALQLLIAAIGGDFATMRLIGASGSCFAVMVYFACMSPRSTILLFFVLPIQAWVLVSVLVAVGAYHSLLEMHGINSNVADAAHVGGALWGWLAFRSFRSFYLVLGSGRGAWFPMLARWRKDRARTQDAGRQLRLDEILDKVQREGMTALTDEERRFLERTSRDLRDR